MAKAKTKTTGLDFNFRLFLATRKHLALSISLIIASILILIFASLPQFNSIMANRKKLGSQQKKLATTEKKALELEQIKFLPEFAQADKVDDVLPSYKPLLELLNSLSQTAQDTKIVITEFKISPGEIASPGAQLETQAKSKKEANYATLDVDLAISGKLYQVEEFIRTIEQVSPLTTIMDISLNRKTEDNKDKDVATQAELSLSTFFFTQSLTATLQSPLPKIGQDEKDIFIQIKEFSPSQLDGQTEIISGNKEDLFGITGLKLENLESELGRESLLKEL